jgi:hypothetical protein
MGGNPIKYYRHVSGPRRKIVRELWDSDGRPWSLLECGHAVPSRYKGAKHLCILMSPGRQCMLCNKIRPAEEKVRRFEYLEDVLVKQAILEGKRRRAAFYFKERGKDVPKKLQRQRCRMALYEDPGLIVPV